MTDKELLEAAHKLSIAEYNCWDYSQKDLINSLYKFGHIVQDNIREKLVAEFAKGRGVFNDEVTT